MPKSPVTTIIGLTMLSIIFMIILQYSITLTLTYEERIAEKELKVIANSIVSQIMDALTLAENLNENGEVQVKLEIPEECSLGHYEITLTNQDNTPVIILKPITRPIPKITLELLISKRKVSITTTVVYSGAKWNYIKVRNVNGIFHVQLVHIGGET